ncbi:MAG: hypothetical protein LQ345_003736 [Seirophora villosa]|nr:MAG: hypothetical protein LQ345_003736 [Seirophora villosa]
MENFTNVPSLLLMQGLALTRSVAVSGDRARQASLDEIHAIKGKTNSPVYYDGVRSSAKEGELTAEFRGVENMGVARLCAQFNVSGEKQNFGQNFPLRPPRSVRHDGTYLVEEASDRRQTFGVKTVNRSTSVASLILLLPP